MIKQFELILEKDNNISSTLITAKSLKSAQAKARKYKKEGYTILTIMEVFSV